MIAGGGLEGAEARGLIPRGIQTHPLPANLYTALLYPIRTCHHFRLMEFALRGDRRGDGPLRHRRDALACPLQAVIYLKAHIARRVHQAVSLGADR
jgi:hypothetical protein